MSHEEGNVPNEQNEHQDQIDLEEIAVTDVSATVSSTDLPEASHQPLPVSTEDESILFVTPTNIKCGVLQSLLESLGMKQDLLLQKVTLLNEMVFPLVQNRSAPSKDTPVTITRHIPAQSLHERQYAATGDIFQDDGGQMFVPIRETTPPLRRCDDVEEEIVVSSTETTPAREAQPEVSPYQQIDNPTIFTIPPRQSDYDVPAPSRSARKTTPNFREEDFPRLERSHRIPALQNLPALTVTPVSVPGQLQASGLRLGGQDLLRFAPLSPLEIPIDQLPFSDEVEIVYSSEGHSSDTNVSVPLPRAGTQRNRNLPERRLSATTQRRPVATSSPSPRQKHPSDRQMRAMERQMERQMGQAVATSSPRSVHSRESRKARHEASNQDLAHLPLYPGKQHQPIPQRIPSGVGRGKALLQMIKGTYDPMRGQHRHGGIGRGSSRY